MEESSRSYATLRHEYRNLEANWLRLFPFTLQNERGPIVRRSPWRLSPHPDLRAAQGGRRALILFQHLPIEPRHQFRSRLVINVPQTDHDAGRPRIHKPPRQSDQPLAFDRLAQPRLAPAEHDKFGWQLEVVDVIRAQKSVLRRASLIDHRERQRRKPRSLAVEQAMRGEVQITITTKLRVESRVPAGFEAGRLESGLGGSERQNSVGLLPGERQAREFARAVAESFLRQMFYAARHGLRLLSRGRGPFPRPSESFVCEMKHRVGNYR